MAQESRHTHTHTHTPEKVTTELKSGFCRVFQTQAPTSPADSPQPRWLLSLFSLLRRSGGSLPRKSKENPRPLDIKAKWGQEVSPWKQGVRANYQTLFPTGLRLHPPSRPADPFLEIEQPRQKGHRRHQHCIWRKWHQGTLQSTSPILGASKQLLSARGSHVSNRHRPSGTSGRLSPLKTRHQNKNLHLKRSRYCREKIP